MSDILARRYAEAYFGLAGEAGKVEAWRSDLLTAAEVLGHTDVATAMENPRATVAERVDLAMHLLDAVSEPARNLCRLLIERGRIKLLPAVLQHYDTLVARKSGRLQVKIEAATQLDAAARAEIVKRLEQDLGAKIDAEFSVHPDLVGGLVLHVGDRIIDNSVRTKLEQLAAKLAA